MPLPSTLPPPRLLLAAMFLTLLGCWTSRKITNVFWMVQAVQRPYARCRLVSKAEFRHAGCWSRCSSPPSSKVKLARPATCHDVGFQMHRLPLPFSGTGGLISISSDNTVLKTPGFGNPSSSHHSTTSQHHGGSPVSRGQGRRFSHSRLAGEEQEGFGHWWRRG